MFARIIIVHGRSSITKTMVNRAIKLLVIIIGWMGGTCEREELASVPTVTVLDYQLSVGRRGRHWTDKILTTGLMGFQTDVRGIATYLTSTNGI